MGTLLKKSAAKVFASPWRAVLVALAAALIWIAQYEKWTLESWSIPTDYYVDAHETLARLKAASEGDIVPLRSQVITRLGAPFGARWNGYPTPDKPLMVLLGALVHAFGLYATANLGLLLATVSAALAFYWVARWLRCRWEWAAAGALLFAFTYHTIHRGLSHYSLVFTWTVPPGLFAVWLVAGSKLLAWNRPGAIVCLVAGLALGVSNPYNLYFWLQLMGWAVVLQWFGMRRRPNLQIGVAAIAVAFVGFAIANGEAWLHVDDTSAVPLLARNYAGTEIYALKPVEMFIPPMFHHWDALAFFGHRYMRWSAWRGEVFLPYLGLAGIAGFVWLAIFTLRRIVARRALPGQALSVGWILAFAAVGGVTNFLALFGGFQVFRATNRAAIFISAIVLFFLVTRLSRVTGKWPAWLRAGAALLIAGLGVYDQIPRRESPQDMAVIEAMVKSDRELGRELERALPKGAMLFQLPVQGFPEVGPEHELNDYEHFRPYFATETLRFSYGAAKMRARSRWQEDLAARPIAELVPRLERYGFAALYINRKGYKDGAESLLRELDAMGYTRRIVGSLNQQIAVFLKPAAQPELPFAETLTLGRGWHLQADDGIRWAYDDGALSYYNPHPHPMTIDVSMTVLAPAPRTVTLLREKTPVASVQIAGDSAKLHVQSVSLAPGVNRFVLKTSTHAQRQGPANQLRAFGVKDVVVSPSTKKPRLASRL